jgi:hypothetical protein
MARDLETLSDKLWELFEEAVQRHPKYEDCAGSGSSTPFNPKIENRGAIANIAQAIVAVNREIRVEKYSEEQQQIADDIDKGIRRDVSVVKKLQLKEP